MGLKPDSLDEILPEIRRHAESEYPRECCGMIFGPAAKRDELSRVRRLRNAQDDYHAKDPQNFPRTSQSAYFMDPKELLSVQKEARRIGEALRHIYHSHIDAGSYFSQEDKRAAAPDGEPAYPGVLYLVVSVLKGKARDWSLFRWDEILRDFVAVVEERNFS